MPAAAPKPPGPRPDLPQPPGPRGAGPSKPLATNPPAGGGAPDERTPPDAPAPPAAPTGPGAGAAIGATPPAPAPETKPTAPPASRGAEAARETLDAFLAAGSVQARAEHVQSRNAVRPEMEAYYEKHPLQTEIGSIAFKLSGQVPDSDRQFHVFQVTTSDQPEGFPVSVEETSDGPKVNWVAFTQFHDNALGKFVKIYQHQPATFHAIVERAHYFRTDVPDVGSKVCLRVRPPIPGYEGYAFIDSESPLAKVASKKFEWDHMYFPVVELKWVKTPEGQQYIEMSRIVQDNWRASD